MENNHALPSGRMSPVHSAAIGGLTSKRSSVNSARSSNQKPPLLLFLKPDGPPRDNSPMWGGCASLGEPSMHNFTECPNDAVESSLSAILQDNVPETYYLSPRVCRGILRRAFMRGRALPEPLLSALTAQSSIPDCNQGGNVAVNVRENKAPAISASASDNMPPAICYNISSSVKSNNPHSDFRETDISRCLDTKVSSPGCNQGGNVVVQALPGQMSTGGGLVKT